MGGLALSLVPHHRGHWIHVALSPPQTGEEHPSMNRLTDALYMVRFKVRARVSGPI